MRPPEDEYVLLVLHAEKATTFPLTEGTEVVIGRGADAEIRVEEGTLSRKHAELRVSRQHVEIRDLHSDNGTWVRQGFTEGMGATPADETRKAGAEAERLPGNRWMSLEPGRVLQLGAVTVILQRRPKRAGASGTTRGASPPSAVTSAGADIVVEDPRMAEVFALIDRVAASPISVLVLGETGTGKEVVAETLWKKSPRAKKPLLRINCAAFAEHLLESELFGHERGAFTGASEAKPGLFEAAHEGTLFLDEIGELPMVTQAKLLRVLEDREVRRIGATTARKIDVRFVAATNRDLEADARAGRFRADLLYRINGISIRLPALRERRTEIVPLAESFVARFAEQAGRAPPHFDRSATEKLLAHPWPGNVRELRNVMERALLYAAGDVVEARHLDLGSAPSPYAVSAYAAPSSHVAPAQLSPSQPAPSFGATHLTDAQREERARIVAALAECAGNQTHAAKRLGISRGTLVSRLDQYDVPRPRK